jgi:MoxR-like ATPase
MPKLAEFGVTAVAGVGELENMRATIEAIRLSDDIVDYVVDLVRATREHPSLQFGASTRAANMVASAARARAALQGRDYVIPDDIKVLALPALRHRVVLAPGAEIEGLGADRVISQILEQTAVPR